MSLVIIIPVLNRPHLVEPLLANIDLNTPDPYRVLWVVDPDDRAEMLALAHARVPPDNVLVSGGSYGKKINLGIKASTEPLVFPAADDLHFHKHWLEEAQKLLTEKIRFIGTQDHGHSLVRKGLHATHPLVARDYIENYGTIDEKGKLYHEGYYHNCVDREACDTARMRGAWAFARGSLVEHRHAAWGKAPDDSTYLKGRTHHREDYALYLERRKKFSLP